MKVKAIIPTAPEILREAVIVLAGAMLAVVVVKALPVEWRRWFNLQEGVSDG